jgi:predicted transcriptional regulator of viral defense system
MDLIKKIHLNFKTDVLPLSLINSILEDKTDNAKKALLKRACKNGDLIRVRNGLYLMGEERRKAPYNLFQIANFMMEPSYVSLESALSFYGLIPEAVYTTTSVTPKKSLEQKSPVGQFSFSYLKTDYFNFAFYKIKHGEHQFLIATPLKALVDYIVLRKKQYKTVEEIKEDLRFDFDEFLTYKKFVNFEKVSEMLNIYKSYRMQVILKEIRKRL